jgi:D-alanyl-D-alanine carboxypeptidase
MILERQGRRFVVVVLGARDKQERYNLTKKIIHQHFAEIEHTITLEQQDISMWQKIINKMFGAQ